ncbi:unnamed protein product [Alopecurus aequalis]
MGVGASRMIVNAVGGAGRTTANANSFSSTLKAVGDNTNIGGFSKIRRYSDIAGFRLPDQITANTTRFGEYCCAIYFGGILGTYGILYGLSHIVSKRRDRRERLRFPRYDDDIKHDDVLQFDDDKYVDAMGSQDQQLVSQWRAVDDMQLAQFEAEIAKLRGAVSRFDLRAEMTELREELLRAGTGAEALEIRKRYDRLLDEISQMACQWRAAADVNLAEFKREMMEVRVEIQEVQQRQNGL